MIRPSDAIKDPGLDGFFKYENGKRVPFKPKMDKYEDECEEFMNKPITPINVFYSQPMHGMSEDEINDRIDRLDNYIYGILMYGGFKQEDILRIEIIDNLHHEGLDADSGRLKHLGASIQLMEDADLVIFEKDMDYEPAKVCRIELNIAEEYGLKHFYVDDYFSYHITAWFKDFLEREKNEN